MIDDADVFQLFWSSSSMRSEYVRQEWEHALILARPNFIRPTYWEDPMPRSDNPPLPPDSLSRLHFHSLVLVDAPAPGSSREAGREPKADDSVSASETVWGSEGAPWEQRQADPGPTGESQPEPMWPRVEDIELAGEIVKDSGDDLAEMRPSTSVARRAAVLVSVVVVVAIVILLLWLR